ncbi:MAG: hypothetical protein NVS2B6_15770 [Thermoleophilaceae bacterium]
MPALPDPRGAAEGRGNARLTEMPGERRPRGGRTMSTDERDAGKVTQAERAGQQRREPEDRDHRADSTGGAKGTRPQRSARGEDGSLGATRARGPERHRAGRHRRVCAPLGHLPPERFHALKVGWLHTCDPDSMSGELVSGAEAVPRITSPGLRDRPRASMVLRQKSSGAMNGSVAL